MEKIKSAKKAALLLFCLALTALGACTLVGLDAQKDYKYTSKTIDPNINKTAREFLESRSYDPKGDSIFNLMRQGIEYAGIDLSEYEKPNRTFVFSTNEAILRLSKGKATTDCYFGYYKVNGVAATKWSDYPKEQVKNFFLYLIAEGNYTFETLTPTPLPVKTLLPANTDPLNPESLMYFRVVNDRNSKLQINDFPGSGNLVITRTAGILSTNGPIHVVDRLVRYQAN
ncbi:MAG TPA: hypothetical protein VF273_00905 [Pelobium sp.]